MKPHLLIPIKIFIKIFIKVVSIGCLIYLFIPAMALLPNITNSHPVKGLLSLLCLVLFPVFINSLFRSMIQDTHQLGLSRIFTVILIATLGFSSFSAIRWMGDWLYHHPPTQTVDYSQLAKLLNTQSWQDANTETHLLLLKVTNRENIGWLSTRAIATFPCAPLQTMDDLWDSASHGRFGFGVQSRLWEKVNYGQIESFNRDAQANFFKQVGWQTTDKNSSEPILIFSLQSPVGHLPSRVGSSAGKACVSNLDQLWFGQSLGCFQKIFVRLNQCDRPSPASTIQTKAAQISP